MLGMVEISEIKDGNSLEAWMQDQPREIALAIAMRAALRVLPVWWDWVIKLEVYDNVEVAVHSVSGCAITSLVAMKQQTNKLEKITTISFNRALAASNAAANYANFGIHSKNAASEAAKAANASAAAKAISKVASSINSDDNFNNVAAVSSAIYVAKTAEMWREIQTDARDIGLRMDAHKLRLWSNTDNSIDAIWKGILKGINKNAGSQDEGNNWSFWISWYQSVLDGRPMLGDVGRTWEMLEKIALIDPSVWDEGPEVVAAEIAKIELEFAKKATPYAETLEFDEGRDEFSVVPRSDLPMRTLLDAADRMRDTAQAIEQKAIGNQHVALLPEADFINEMVGRYSGNAMRLHEVCTKVEMHIISLQAEGGLPEVDNLVGDVLSDMRNTADDIAAFDPYVAEVLDARAKLRFARLTDAQKEPIGHFAEAVAVKSTPPLAQEMREDVSTVMSEDDPTTATTPDRYRLVSRLIKVATFGSVATAGIVAALANVEGAAKGVQFLWAIIRPLLGL